MQYIGPDRVEVLSAAFSSSCPPTFPQDTDARCLESSPLAPIGFLYPKVYAHKLDKHSNSGSDRLSLCLPVSSMALASSRVVNAILCW